MGSLRYEKDNFFVKVLFWAKVGHLPYIHKRERERNTEPEKDFDDVEQMVHTLGFAGVVLSS